MKLVGFVTAGPGGAMTDEVGVITGDLSLATEDLGDGTAALTVQYTGAEEWYTLTGSPVPLPEAALAGLHERALDALRAGGAARVPVPAPRSEAEPAAGQRSEGPAAGKSSAR
ncbi:hypothetical protein ACIRP0_08060 [Streptomyces sp. NPDC101733]|uniref:hypothetical protein n=1 Tax=unclassified Streptomyces TaxID=2593676 RepID=UPI003805030A